DRDKVASLRFTLPLLKALANDRDYSGKLSKRTLNVVIFIVLHERSIYRWITDDECPNEVSLLDFQEKFKGFVFRRGMKIGTGLSPLPTFVQSSEGPICRKDRLSPSPVLPVDSSFHLGARKFPFSEERRKLRDFRG
ncbi:hypothetical protein V1477_001789, partial [Vespula maculifrons]